jgi:hypothetical protein
MGESLTITWSSIVRYPAYEVSNLGDVRSITGRPITPLVGTHGYLRVLLHFRGRRRWRDVHRLVAESHVPGREQGMVVDHINRDRLDNKAANLRWVTVAENNRNRGKTRHD